MVIECTICQARFRMRESIMRGFKGAEVRCRKCGGIIVIMTPATVQGTETLERGADPRRLPTSPREKPGTFAGREEPAPEPAPRGLPAGEGRAKPRTALAEKTEPEEAIPDNVYSLEHYREIRPRKFPADGFDISGFIRPEPVVPQPVPEPEPVSLPADPPSVPAENDSTQESLLYQRIAWQKEGILPPPSEEPLPSPAKETPPRKSLFRRRRGKTGNLHPMFPRASDIALVYLLLLLAGGVGYLVVRYLAPLFAFHLR